jgi:hypothetical protein
MKQFPNVKETYTRWKIPGKAIQESILAETYKKLQKGTR